jgi:hypothetical protein
MSVTSETRAFARCSALPLSQPAIRKGARSMTERIRNILSIGMVLVLILAVGVLAVVR